MHNKGHIEYFLYDITEIISYITCVSPPMSSTFLTTFFATLGPSTLTTASFTATSFTTTSNRLNRMCVYIPHLITFVRMGHTTRTIGRICAQNKSRTRRRIRNRAITYHTYTRHILYLGIFMDMHNK